MERHEVVTGPQDVYLQYACGPNFALNGAYCRLEVSKYGSQDNKSQVEQRFHEFYYMPLGILGDKAM